MTTDKIKKFLLPNFPYIMLFWFFSKCGESYRISTESDTLRKLMDAIANLNVALSRPLPTFNPFDLCVGLIGAAAVFGMVYYKKKNAKKWRRDIEYGSARWGGKKDIAPYVDPKPENNLILTATESLMLNGRPPNPKYARNKNVLIVGGSSSGKTRFFLKPNLMQMHSSYCITDPKGTILIECGKLLKRNGYEIKVLNTIDFAKSMHYNPFPLLYKGGKRNTPQIQGSHYVCGTRTDGHATAQSRERKRLWKSITSRLATICCPRSNSQNRRMRRRLVATA